MTSVQTSPSPAALPERGGGSSISRLRALGRAEWLQFTRNRLLVILALLFPAVLPLFVWMVGDQSVGSTAVASEIFILFALGFGVYYPALSMAVTRRDENVLKRLRTGEARDWEILTAICVPLAVAMLALTVVIVVAFSTMSMFMPLEAPVPHVWPVNPLLMLVVTVLGIAVSHGFALLTSTFTANAENAQITSMPVLILMILSQSTFRELMPEGVAKVLDMTPFALAIGLFRDGWIGESFTATFADSWVQLLTLAAWAVALVWGGYQYMRWETHR